MPGLVGRVFPQRIFFSMSCSIKDAFSGAYYNISTYCDAFDVLAKVKTFSFCAFLEMGMLKI